MYLVETNDKVTVLINKSSTLNFVNDVTNDTSILLNHIEENIYINSTDAPSFLMRFVGNFSDSIYGIESMVDPEILSAQDIPILSRSLIDYIYFGNEVTIDYCNVDNMDSWFRIDTNNLEIYEVDILGKTLCV